MIFAAAMMALFLQNPGGTLYSDNAPSLFLFRDLKARSLNDILTIQVNENATASNSANTSTKKEGDVSVSFKRSAPTQWSIEVCDTGAGIPVSEQRNIFEPFRQGPTPNQHAPGVGIGLSLVARFAELHGGRAWVEPREKGGSSFRVFLPNS